MLHSRAPVKSALVVGLRIKMAALLNVWMRVVMIGVGTRPHPVGAYPQDLDAALMVLQDLRQEVVVSI